MKTDFLTKKALVLIASAVACTACAQMDNTVARSAAGGDRLMSPSYASGSPTDQYGNDIAIRRTIDTVITQGSQDLLSSRAIRLPERPLGEIAVFGYQFPSICGGHEFRVYETPDTQILEYQYDSQDGSTKIIRDYISGPSPFVEPGLWSAYDHTADSISTMSSRFEQRKGKSMNGVYSQGLVTNLPDEEQRLLGGAYQQALSDVRGCADTPALANASTH